MSYSIKDNEAVQINAPASDITIRLTEHGSDWYWAAFSILAVTTIAYVVSSAYVPRRERIFHYFSIGAAMFASLTYFTMASDLGSTGIATEFTHYQGGGIRQVFYARYIGWFMASPLILANIFLFSGVSWPTMLMALAAQEVYVVDMLIGSLVSSSYKWGYFSFGVAAWLLVMYHLIFVAMPVAKTQGADVFKHFMVMLCGVSFIWTLYPIAWGLSEGGNVIAPDSEAAFYGVLDMITLPVLGSYFIYASRKISIERLGLVFERGFKSSAAMTLPITEKIVESSSQPTQPEQRHSNETVVVPGSGATEQTV
ncbi:uncharacterized protein V1516DRAFT_669871 [Lipomyces oligophaga]|uniref:uncharacterized protein n=1 Tax=Lipomyces oligophaga TaxID=45792 RepID=UPI0034CDA050